MEPCTLLQNIELKYSEM